MMVYINGSPKLKVSNSQAFIDEINDNSKIKYVYKDNFKNIVKEIIKSDTIIFSFPLYVDSPPSKILELIEYIQHKNIDLKGKNIYVICNSGFLEANQNLMATKIIENFCLNNNINYKGSFCIGAGEIIGKYKSNKLYKFVSMDYLRKSKKFKKAIKNKKEINLFTTIHPMTKRLYIYLANISWNKKIKLNKS